MTQPRFQMAWRRFTRAAVGFLVITGCATDREPPVGNTGTWLRYDGSYGYTPEQAAAQADCGEQTHSGSTSGFVKLTQATDRTTVYWEGFGCKLETENVDGGPLTTTDGLCALDGTLAKFALASIAFQTFALDLDVGTLSAQGLITRSSDPALSFCFSLDATVAPAP